MVEIVFSPKAAQDIDLIYDHTEERWGIDQAERYTNDLRNACEELAFKPRLGRPIGHVRMGYFMLVSGSHNIFFREDKARIVIVRILHARMDFKRHL